MRKLLNISIPYGVENPSFVNYEIHENMDIISYGRLYLDGTAYVSCWKDTSYMVEDVDSSILFDFIDEKKESEDIVVYLTLSFDEFQEIVKAETEYLDECSREDLHDDYLMHNFCASNMEEVDKKKKENQKKLKKMLFKVLDNIK